MGMGMMSFRRSALPIPSYLYYSSLSGAENAPRTSDLDGICIDILSLSMVRIVYIAFSGYHTLTFLRQYHYLHTHVYSVYR